MKVGYKQLIADAELEIETLDPGDAIALLADPQTQLIDLRDIRELQREGKVPSAFHAPRGMLEFWVDPDSPYHKDIFSSGKRLVFYCQSGWRSALATQAVQRMGLTRVAHVGGGFAAWKAAGGPVEAVERS